MPSAATSAALPASARRRSAPDTIQCFAAGRHVSLSGAALAFAAADLLATAQAYDPALHEAPLVVGHPTLDGPAYGWVGGVASDGRTLEAAPRQVNPEFAQLVNAGAFKKVSAAFWAPDAPGNPVPGVYYLRHIGFLGAMAPAVHGLRTPQFAGSADGVVEFSAEWDDVDNASLWRGLRDWLLAKFGQDEADKAMPPYLVASLERGAQQELAQAQAEASDSTDAGALPAFAAPRRSTPDPLETSAVTLTEKAALEAENATLKQQLADQAGASRKARLDAAHTDAVAFAAGLVASASLAVDQRELVIQLFDTVALHEADSGAVVQFAAAPGAAPAPLVPALKALLGGLAPRATVGRVATAGAAAAAGAAVSFAAPAGAEVDSVSLAVHHKVQDYQRAHPGTAYTAALGAVLADAC